MQVKFLGLFYNKMPMHDTLCCSRLGKLKCSMLYAIDFLSAPPPPSTFPSAEIANNNNEKSKKKLLQLKMYLLWPKVLRKREREMGN